ncbi:hypothetical protein ZIOFF_021364 [Zingiber officinale]|uniref:Uncharacterized protein n=1 Tax=Zingiber officinale TaxID=94328 RepID=A0A8J5H6S4_ZINOF|nr:hypothetical protein ZIOFF_021364 [Zingiber officinale]
MKHSRCDLDVITYNGMVSSFSRYNLFHEAIILELVNPRLKPNVVAIASVLLTISGGIKFKADQDEPSPYGAMLAAQDAVQRCKELRIAALHIKLRATGGNKTKTLGPSA